MSGPQGAYPKRSSSEAQHGTSTCNRVFVVSPPSSGNQELVQTSQYQNYSAESDSFRAVFSSEICIV